MAPEHRAASRSQLLTDNEATYLTSRLAYACGCLDDVIEPAGTREVQWGALAALGTCRERHRRRHHSTIPF